MISLLVRQLTFQIWATVVIGATTGIPWKGIRPRGMTFKDFSDRRVLLLPENDIIGTEVMISIAIYCRSTKVKHTGNSLRWKEKSRSRRATQVITAASYWSCSDSSPSYSLASPLSQSWVCNLWARYNRTSGLYGTIRSRCEQTSATTRIRAPKRRIKRRIWCKKCSGLLRHYLRKSMILRIHKRKSKYRSPKGSWSKMIKSRSLQL